VAELADARDLKSRDRKVVRVRFPAPAPQHNYPAWRAAWKAVGIERIPHDFRRTAVRNFERAGVPRTTAMAMVGHKTESIYRRYSIVDQAMLEVGASKLDQLQQAQGLSKPVVVSSNGSGRPRVEWRAGTLALTRDTTSEALRAAWNVATQTRR
jgi:hypothetical protein